MHESGKPNLLKPSLFRFPCYLKYSTTRIPAILNPRFLEYSATRIPAISNPRFLEYSAISNTPPLEFPLSRIPAISNNFATGNPAFLIPTRGVISVPVW